MAPELTHLLNVARRSVNERGIIETLIQGPRYITTYLKRRRAWQRVEQEESFDQKYGTDTTAILRQEDFGSTSENLCHAEYFRSTPPRLFERIMAAMKIRYEDFIFIDFGSGKGRTLLMASEYPFKRVIGVEMSEKLHVIAQKNIRVYQSKTQKCRKFQIECADATSYSLPVENTIFFLFDPFRRPVMESVVNNIGQSLNKHPRTIFIAYANPNQSVVMDQSGFLERVYASKGGAPENSAEYELAIPWHIYTNKGL